MKRIAFLVAAAGAFGLAPLAARLGAIGGAACLVVLAVSLALAASGAISATSAALGSVGAFAGGLIAPSSSALAGALLLALCFGERTLRVRATQAKLVHLGVAATAGALAGALSAHYVTAPLAVRGVVLVVAAVLAALPLLVEADDPMAHALDEIAKDIGDPARSSLARAATLCRSADESLLDRPTADQVRQTWQNLLRLAQARARLERTPEASALLPASDTGYGSAVRQRLDDRISDHVTALARAYTAADAAKAAEASLDDGALRSVDTAGESLEQVSKAIVEDV